MPETTKSRYDAMTGESYAFFEGDIRGRRFCQEYWTVPEHSTKLVVFEEGTGTRIHTISVEETDEKYPDGSFLKAEKRYDESRRKHMFHISRGWYKD